MDDLTLARMKELKQQGFFCSQILMTLGMELQGKENTDLIRAMNGLAGNQLDAGRHRGRARPGGQLRAS